MKPVNDWMEMRSIEQTPSKLSTEEIVWVVAFLVVRRGSVCI